MEKIYIFGHRNPDTDSVTSAISLEYLKKQLGYNVEARVLGELNDETRFILNYFNVKSPKYLNDVKLQVKDIFYHKGCFLKGTSSIEDTYKFMNEKNITGVPIIDDNKKFIGIITAKNILNKIFNWSDGLITSYTNIIKTLNGIEVLKFDEEITGNVIGASYKSTTFLENITLKESDILIVGDRHSIIERAVLSKIKLLIVTGNGTIKEQHIKIAEENKVNIIKTPYDTFNTINKILFSNYIKSALKEERSYTVEENEYYEDFLDKANQLGFNNYPIVDKNKVCKGLIRLTETNSKKRKKVILVDHNESEQSAIGLEETDILEVIDHHKIGDISTNAPINFRNMAVGSTNTIIYHLYQENRVVIPYPIAGIMLSGILSDTLALTSPTTTDIDKEVVKNLEEITHLSYQEYSRKMFSESLNLNKKSPSDLINMDLKTFQTNSGFFKVSQIITLNPTNVLEKKEDIIKELETQLGQDIFIIFMITDILKNGSYFLYTESAEEYLKKMFKRNIYQGFYVEGCVSRKKQIIPYIMEGE